MIDFPPLDLGIEILVASRYWGSNKSNLGDFYEDRVVISTKMSL